MIFGHIQQADADFRWLPAPFRTVLEHLKATDFEAKPAGSYELQGKDIYIQVMDVTTKPLSETRPEVHARYIDVQYIVHGREKIGVVIDDGRNEVADDWLADRDVLFYRDTENETVVELHPGNFAVFFPFDVHRPLCQVDGPEPVRKVVAKIAVALLAK